MAFENEKDTELFEEQEQVTVDTSDEQDLLNEILEDEDGDFNPFAEKKETKKAKKPLDPRRLKAGSMALALTAIVVVAVFLFNIVVGLIEKRFPLVLDATSNQLYTLTDEFKSFADGIDKEVNITVCVPESELKTPATGMDEFNNTFIQLHTALESLNRLSDGKVTVKYIDLSADPTAATEMAALDATEGSILFTCGNLSRVTSLTEDYTNYGMEELYSYYYSYGTLPAIQSMVEHTLAVNLHAVTADKETTITFLTGHDEDATTISVLQTLLRQQGYKVESVDVTTAATYADDCRMVVIAAPTEDYTDDEIAALRTWLANEDKYERHLLYLPTLACSTTKLDTFVSDTYGITVAGTVAVQENASNRPPVSYNAYYYSYAESQATEFTTGGVRVIAALNRILLKNDKATGTVSPLFVFPEGTKEISVTAENAEPVATADTKPIGAMMARNVNNNCDSYAVVFGGPAFLQFFESYPENEQLILETVNGILENESALNLPGRTVTGNSTFSVGSMSAAYVLFTIFVILLPLGTLAICLVVFLKRRHL